MGAAGSGRGRRQRRRVLPFVHEVRRIDAYELFSKTCPIEKMNCFMTHGYIFERVSSATYQIERHGILLLGSLKVLKVDCMPNVARYLFECPSCGSRRCFLSLSQNAITCRGCLKLAYKSQNMTLARRLIAKSKKFERKLHAFIFLDFKPKGMHNKTYQQLFDEWYEVEQKGM